jgi:hypothetical protein
MAGTLAIVLAGAALTWAIYRVLARRFRAAYERDVDRALARLPSSRPAVTDAELEHLPAPVARYLRAAESSATRASTTSASGCTGGFEAVQPHAGFHSSPSSTTSSTSRRGFSI